ncbi:MAG: hypothetical protein ACR2ND_09475 [Solirubrobacteraceae bacterium]
MSNRTIAPLLLGLLLVSLGTAATGASADLVLTGTNSTLVISPDGSRTIINRSTYAPRIVQSADNGNANANAPSPGSSGDAFATGPSNSSSVQGISNQQNAGIESGGGTTIINRSNFAPTITQNATNTNSNGVQGAGGGSGDTFTTGSTNTSNAQGISNTQNASLIVGGGPGVLIVNGASFTPTVTQSAANGQGQGQLLLSGL